MAATELPVPTTLRTLACPRVATDALVADMADRLPRGGMAAAALPEGHRLATATHRLLDSRILAVAAEILDLDVAGELVNWLARYARVREAGERTLADPRQPELLETLLEPYPMHVTDDLGVEIRIQGSPVATIRFHLDVTAELGETSLVVRLGELSEVVCQALSVSATLTLVGWSTPLWNTGPHELPEVHVSLDPPVPVVRLPVPRTAADRDPRRTTSRPPVPAVGGAVAPRHSG